MLVCQFLRLSGGGTFFLELLLVKKIFSSFYTPKTRHVTNRGFVVCICCFFLKLIFLYFIACFNLVVIWDGEKNEQYTIEVFEEKKVFV